MNEENPKVKNPNIGVIYPGQGAQYVGMARDMYESYAQARELFDFADSILGFSLRRLCFEGPASELQLTKHAQPAILLHSYIATVLLWEHLGELRKRVQLIAGHSLGEISALTAFGAILPDEALKLVYHRGLFMQEAVPVGEGAMVAVIGSSLEVIQALCSEVSRGVVSLANDNSDNQVVVSGHATAVNEFVEKARERGVRTIPLSVSAPFHCSLMTPARERFSEYLSTVKIRDLEVPLVNNVDATAIRSAVKIRESLVTQITSPVRWRETMHRFASRGVSTVIEIGPGKILSGLARRIRTEPRIHVESLSTVADLNRIIERFGK